MQYNAVHVLKDLKYLKMRKIHLHSFYADGSITFRTIISFGGGRSTKKSYFGHQFHQGFGTYAYPPSIPSGFLDPHHSDGSGGGLFRNHLRLGATPLAENMVILSTNSHELFTLEGWTS
jgi:hypothetical protein